MLKLLRMGYYYLAFVLVAAATLPVFFLRPFNPKNTSLFFSVFSRATFWAMGIQYEEIDRHIMEENRPGVLVGNHQHNMDAMMASRAFSKQVVVLGKKEILRVPFIGLCFYLGGNVFIDRSNRANALKSLEKVRNKLVQNKLSVLIFPEGTRNQGEKLLPFKRGAFITAIRTQLPIVPFAVSPYAKTLNMNKLKAGKMTVRYLPPISTEGLGPEDAPLLARQARDAVAQAIKEMDGGSLKNVV